MIDKMDRAACEIGWSLIQVSVGAGPKNTAAIRNEAFGRSTVEV